MENLEISDNLIKKHITDLEKKLKAIKSEKDFVYQEQQIKKFQNEIKVLLNEIDLFELEIFSAPSDQRNKYMPKYDQYLADKNKFQKEINKVKNENKKSPQNDLFDKETIERNQPKQFEQMEREELINHIDNKQDQADKNLDDIIKELNQGKDLMQEINIETQNQIDRLQSIQEQIKDTYSLTKRSKKLVRYFQKTIMTDKLICGCIVLICIAILIIIILKIVGFKGDSFNSI